MCVVTEIRCPVCKKVIPSDDVECHLVICLTKPQITYNGTLTGDMSAVLTPLLHNILCFILLSNHVTG